jgi:acyl-CoA synthetase (AMP-forming)/AMP-acid ligase II/acyl carrier protein
MDFPQEAPIPGDLQLTPEQATIITVLRHRAVLNPDQRVFTFLPAGGEEEIPLSYRGLAEGAEIVAARLTELGLKGRKVLMFYPAGLDFITAFVGCLWAGVIPVPAYPPRKNRSLQRIHAIVGNCGAVAILTTTAISHMIRRNFSEDPLLKDLSWYLTETWTQPEFPVPDIPEPAFEDLAFLQYTSGSTGEPKGVMVSHRNIMYNLRSLQLYFRTTREDVALFWLPQFHDLGLFSGILEGIFSGIHTVLISPVTFISNPILLFQAIQRFRVSITGQPDFAFNHCIDKTTEEQRSKLDLSSLRILFNAAEPVRKSTFDRFLDAFSTTGITPGILFPGYGLAESTLILTGKEIDKPPFYLPVNATLLGQNKVVVVSPEEKDIRWITGNGKPKMDTRILIVDPETREISPSGEVGEIWASGSTIALGYNGLPDLTLEVFHSSPAGQKDPSWLRTGDLGFLHNGELFITGRLKDLIIIHGRNFYPQDIEQAVEESHSALRRTFSAAFSIEMKGEERLGIVAELHKSIIPHDTGKVIAAVVAAVSREFEIQPGRVALIRTGTLPKTTSGKVMRRAVREMLLSGKSEILDDREFDEAEMIQSELELLESSGLEHFLVTWISHHLNNGQPVDAEKSLADYGLDSLRAVLLTDDTKNMFGFEWPPYLFFEEISIRKLSEEGMKLMEM